MRETRERIIDAAAAALRQHGYAGASARAIAAAGGFNAALIYYYFNDLDDLFLAVLDQTSAGRMSAYLERTQTVTTVDELIAAARELFDDDVAAGHITVLTELVAAALPNPSLGIEIAARMEPWIRLAQDTIDRLTSGTMLAPLIDARALAESLVGLYIGIETMMHLDGNAARAKKLFGMAAAAAPFLTPFLQPS